MCLNDAPSIAHPQAHVPAQMLAPVTIPLRIVAAMFSHVVIFWTQTDVPNATEQLLAGAEKYLKPCPGVLHYHCGQMAGSHRDVVDQSYQVALNLVFEDKSRAGRLPDASLARGVCGKSLQDLLRARGRLRL